MRDEADLSTDLKGFNIRLRDSLAAGRIAVPFLQEVELGGVPKLPKRVERLSINQMCAFVAPEVGIADAGNLEARAWRARLPVIHLCAALVVELARQPRPDWPANPIYTLAIDLTLVPTVLGEAQRFEGLLQLSRLKIDPNSLIRFRARSDQVQRIAAA